MGDDRAQAESERIAEIIAIEDHLILLALLTPNSLAFLGRLVFSFLFTGRYPHLQVYKRLNFWPENSELFLGI
jgi:hypothetical protein